MDEALGRDHRDVSFWLDSLVESGSDDLTPRTSLPGDREFDVAIVGGGLTGLWSAYYLLKRSPGLRIAILEKEIAGFGASGRNGGWCSALFPASTAALERRHGLPAALAMRRAMIATVAEVGRVTTAEGIECDFVQGGTLLFARSKPQYVRAREEVAEAEHYGVDQISWDRERTFPTNTLATVLEPACARLHPGKLVRGLARVVERMGAEIFEQTEVLSWEPHRVTTTRGTVMADTIVIATEGFGASFRQTHRRVLPLYSLMIATEPLPDALWDDIGIEHGQTFGDFRHLLVYGQRTADNRFAFGGRGARYHWGSSIRPDYDTVPRVFEHLRRTLVELFPQVSDAAVTHRWGGPIGVPRDWHAAVDHDAASGIVWAGGYVGDGLSTTNLAGRTIADLMTGEDSELVELPWVNHRSREWEPEPLRFVGANLGLLAMELADLEERVTRRPSLAAKIMAPLVGG
ncbi:FAD-dependent oxidoreductase [Leifsonia bigeumensis]|uniref:FAD-dependent oxidoreductase n=1 Tax=Leifsonella bigeumensis TaxID=433643 RepID=A0ABP7FZA5_9MICO